MKRLTSRVRAFTLIELLIVITIIGILAVALIPRITGGPAKARDAQRKADLQAIATALEFYADDHSGQYPSTNGCVSTISTDIDDYLSTVPSDPSGSTGTAAGNCSTGYGYTGLTSTGSTYVGYILFADLESSTAYGTGIYQGFVPTVASTYSGNTSSKTTCSSSSTCTDPTYHVGR